MNTDLIRTTLDRLESSEAGAGTRSEAIERYQWPLGAGLLFLLLGMAVRPRVRNGVAAPAAVAVCIFGPLGDAAQGGVLSEAYALYRDGAFEESYESFQDALEADPGLDRNHRLQLGLGSAAYRLGKHEEAQQAFADALVSEEPSVQGRAHYGLASTLFRMGEHRLAPPGDSQTQSTPPEPGRTAAKPDVEAVLRDWRGALEHYEASLTHLPDDPDTAHNIDVVRKRIEELERQLEEEQKQEQEQQEPQNADQEPSEAEKEGEESEENSDRPQPEDSQGKEGEPQEDAGTSPPEGTPPEAEPSEGGDAKTRPERGARGRRRAGTRKENTRGSCRRTTR